MWSDFGGEGRRNLQFEATCVNIFRHAGSSSTGSLFSAVRFFFENVRTRFNLIYFFPAEVMFMFQEPTSSSGHGNKLQPICPLVTVSYAIIPVQECAFSTSLTLLNCRRWKRFRVSQPSLESVSQNMQKKRKAGGAGRGRGGGGEGHG